MSITKREHMRAMAVCDHWFEVWSALDNLIEAWETLPGGKNHSPAVVEQWLAAYMAPAITEGRKVLGRKAPNEQA